MEAPDQASDIKSYFDQFDSIMVDRIESYEAAEDLTGKEIAETVLLSVATAKHSFEAFRDAYEDHLESERLPDIFTDAYLTMAKEINMLWGGLSLASEFPINGDELVEWMDPDVDGPEVTKKHTEGVAAFLIGIQDAMMPLRKIMVEEAREGEVDSRVYAQVAYEHYIQSVLSTCDCPYMEQAFDKGVQLEGIKQEFEDTFQSLQDEAEREQELNLEERHSSEDASEDSSSADPKLEDSIDEEEVSDDLRSMINDSDSIMN